ncbi:MAG: efflux RND transporter periplasmic adaptor subunit [FCB group bacterium]|nr:efflux RND transporter periplasmic adaptor subunit [FCB group bacterium]
MKMKRTLEIIIILSLFACGGKNSKQDAVEEKVIPVNITTVTQQPIRETATFFGDILASESVKVYSTIPNKIVRLYHDIGDEVKAGDLLAEINTEKIHQAVSQAEAGLEAAQAQYDNTRLEFDRLAKLYKENAVSQSQMDAMRTQLDAAKSSVKQLKAALSTARSQLKDTRITAPVSGVIVLRSLNEGDQAAPQIPLFEIANMDTVRVLINVIERQLPQIQPGQLARAEVTAYPEISFEGKVIRVNPTLNSMTRTAKAEIRIPNRDHRLRPGMFSKVSVILNQHENAVVISKACILEKTRLAYDNGQLSTARVVMDRFVYVIEDDRAVLRPVETGIIEDNLAEIITGLKPGEEIVTVGQHNLEAGDSVQVVSATDE